MPRTRLHSTLYLQVLAAIVIGVAFGYLSPGAAQRMQPLGEAFIRAMRMLIAPIIFCTVVHGIAAMDDLRTAGRVALKALLYFEAVTTLALIIGLVVVNLWQPGAGMNVDATTLDPDAVASYATQARQQSPVEFLLHIIPQTVTGAFADGEILQVLFVSVLFGVALFHLGERGKPLLQLIDLVSRTIFGVVGVVMKAAPLGAFGAMAFTIGRYGIGSLLSLGKLMADVYLTCLFFICVVLGGIAAFTGFNLWKFLRYIREEILIVLGTSSSESVLPQLMAKLERLGCSKSVVGLVVPTGYSFNLDGTSIYMTMAALFVAQVSGVHLSLVQELSVLGILLLTSKGAAAVTGSGFVTLAATLSAFPAIPIAGLALLLGVDRFMSEARAITNLIGNGVATMVIARWEGDLDMARVRAVLNGGLVEHAQHPSGSSQTTPAPIFCGPTEATPQLAPSREL
jgi:aerobic C4-dicarboxylate transport protein